MSLYDDNLQETEWTRPYYMVLVGQRFLNAHSSASPKLYLHEGTAKRWAKRMDGKVYKVYLNMIPVD